MATFCAMLGSLFSIMTILLIAQAARAGRCDHNQHRSRQKSNSFRYHYSKAIRELVLDNVLISQTARQQKELMEDFHREGSKTSDWDGRNSVHGVNSQMISNNDYYGVGRPVSICRTLTVPSGPGVGKDRYLQYMH